MKRRNFLTFLSLTGIVGVLKTNSVLATEEQEKLNDSSLKDRVYWYKLLYKIANPVISNLAAGTLVKNMPLVKSPTFDSRSPKVSYLEAVGRTYAGIAPWLTLPDDDTDEGKLRTKMKLEAVKGLDNCFTENSSDQLVFTKDYQPIVDAAYLAQSFLRAPQALWHPLKPQTKQAIVNSFKSLRNRKPFKSNWLLFGSITEAFLLSIGEDVDKERLNEGVSKLTNGTKVMVGTEMVQTLHLITTTLLLYIP